MTVTADRRQIPKILISEGVVVMMMDFGYSHRLYRVMDASRTGECTYQTVVFDGSLTVENLAAFGVFDMENPIGRPIIKLLDVRTIRVHPDTLAQTENVSSGL